MKVRVTRSICAYGNYNWINEGSIVKAEILIDNPSYCAVEYEGMILIIPVDAIEVVVND